MVISTPDRRLRVFVSSAMGELAVERQAVVRAIRALRLTPVLFDAGARPHPPRELYQASLAQSDVFIGIYWQRYGEVSAGLEVSGLEEEFLRSGTGGQPRLLYVKTPAPDREPRLTELLARISNEASYRRFSTPAELGRLVRDDLAALLSERFAASSAASAAPSSSRSRRLPASTTSMVGREQAIDEVAGLLAQPEVRLVTLTGPGGVGKTRLALAVGELLRDRFDEVVFVPLETATRPQQVLAGIARAVGADLAGTDSPLQVLVEQLAGRRWLLILDNLEQVLDAVGDLAELLARSAQVAILATSRTVLGLRAEHDYPVPPLMLATDPTESVETLIASPAVALFVDRARAVRPDFALTEENAAAVAEICRRLEGLPLAIELAAPRTRLLDPDELLGRLATSLDALGTGSVDMPQRQRTLRATVQWSVDLLDDDERSLLETTAIFVDGWTVDAAGQVAGLAEDRTLELSEALQRSSLIQLDSAEGGPRCRMLNVIRRFVAERLAARPDVAEIGRRHADYYRALAEQADRPLRGLGQDHAAEGLEAEAANLAAAVDWYLAHDRAPLPHLFRVLWLFWGLRDHLGEARGWVDQLMPTVEEWDLYAQAELWWLAATIAVEVVGQDQALAASERLESLLPGIRDPYLHVVSELAMAGISFVVGDFEGALRTELACVEELRGQDEPYWTTVAVLTVGLVETAMGRPEDALGHLREARALAERFDHGGLSAWSQIQLGILALVRGRPEEAQALLDEGLELTLAAHSTRNVTLCLTAFAQLAFVQGKGERAALLAGAAEGLRQRVGLRAWPLQQQGEAQTVAQIRQALGADRFDRDFAAGVRLDRQQAIAAVRDGPLSQALALVATVPVAIHSGCPARMAPGYGRCVCTVVISLAPAEPRPLLLMGFRDEFTGRPWQPPARHWPGSPLIGGRDLQAGGTWLAVQPAVPRVSCILNTRGQEAVPGHRRSRGELPLRAATEGPRALRELHENPGDLASYDPFFLVCADLASAQMLSWDGRRTSLEDLDPATHVITNAGHLYPPPASQAPADRSTPPDPQALPDGQAPPDPEAKADHFGPKFAAHRPSADPAATIKDAWSDWLTLAGGDGLADTDAAAIIARRELPDGRMWGTTSVSLVALGRDGLRYDFQPVPADTTTWYTVDLDRR